MPKERNYNPVQAQHKADKAKAIKKGKAEIQERRNERLARKDPQRVQKQIDDLKAISVGGGKLSRNEEQLLEALEKEIRGIRKARDSLGDRAPSFGRGSRRERDTGVLGKRRRGSSGSSTDDDVPDDVRRIPMPRDTPPPIPKDVLDQWHAKRRARRNQENEQKGESLPASDETPKVQPTPSGPQTVYEAKPVLRDLRKEAVSAFVPAAVQRKLNKGKGQGGLLEPEEADDLERQGYLKTGNAGPVDDTDDHPKPKPLAPTIEDAEEDDE